MNNSDYCESEMRTNSCDVDCVPVKIEPATEVENFRIQSHNRPPPKILNGLLGKRKQPTLSSTLSDNYKTPTLSNAPKPIRRLLVIRRQPASLQSPPKESCGNAALVASPSLDTTHASSPPPAPTANNKTHPPPPKLKLKVKCLCKLTQQSPAMEPNTTEAETKASRDFFTLMYKQTLQLTRAQQRRIKTELLAALCEAETHAEAGRSCALCCT